MEKETEKNSFDPPETSKIKKDYNKIRRDKAKYYRSRAPLEIKSLMDLIELLKQSNHCAEKVYDLMKDLEKSNLHRIRNLRYEKQPNDEYAAQILSTCNKLSSNVGDRVSRSLERSYYPYQREGEHRSPGRPQENCTDQQKMSDREKDRKTQKKSIQLKDDEIHKLGNEIKKHDDNIKTHFELNNKSLIQVDEVADILREPIRELNEAEHGLLNTALAAIHQVKESMEKLRDHYENANFSNGLTDCVGESSTSQRVDVRIRPYPAQGSNDGTTRMKTKSRDCSQSGSFEGAPKTEQSSQEQVMHGVANPDSFTYQQGWNNQYYNSLNHPSVSHHTDRMRTEETVDAGSSFNYYTDAPAYFQDFPPGVLDPTCGVETPQLYSQQSQHHTDTTMAYSNTVNFNPGLLGQGVGLFQNIGMDYGPGNNDPGPSSSFTNNLDPYEQPANFLLLENQPTNPPMGSFLKELARSEAEDGLSNEAGI